MADTALLAVGLAAVAGGLAALAWARSRRGDERGSRFRTSPHYTQGLHYLTGGQLEPAISELTKVTRDEPGAVDVVLVLSHLLREAGQVQKAIQLHQGLLARPDLSRAERAYVLAALGTDFRKAGFLDRAARAYADALDVDPGNIQSLVGQQKLFEEQRQWHQAYEVQARLSRLRKTDDSLVLAHLQAQIGREAADMGRREAAEAAFMTALALDRRVLPAHLGLAQLYAESDPRRAAAILEDALALVPERAYIAFEPLARAYSDCGEPSRFVAACERLVRQDPRDWRGRVALARHLRAEGKPDESLGLLLRAVEANPQVLLVHLEVWRTLKALGLVGDAEARYVSVAEGSAFYVDPHICTSCRYRADDMLWRCPHCHEWDTFVEERLGPSESR
ncbi:MAG TPA: tetratricopeptide repeat protein [Vicinamibacteria bacterium]|nr:tetratricopeptide repeat protein [Vicinamibacteria bacterium]